MMEMMRHAYDWLAIASQNTVATVCLIGAVVFYFYSILDRRIPSLFVPPIIGLLVYFGAYTFGKLDGTEKEKAACEVRINIAKQDLLNRYGKATLTLQYIEREYANSKKEMADKQREYEEELDNLLASLQQERAENAADELVKTKDTANATVKANSCLATLIDPSIVRNLNKSR